MKIRHGFVSNSSSSSFIIAIKKPIPICPHCNQSPIDFLKVLEIKIGNKQTEYAYFIYNINDLISQNKYDIEDLKQSKIEIEKGLVAYKAISSDPKSKKIADEILDQITQTNRSVIKSKLSPDNKNYCEGDDAWIQNLKWSSSAIDLKIKKLESVLYVIDKDIENKESLIEKIKKNLYRMTNIKYLL